MAIHLASHVAIIPYLRHYPSTKEESNSRLITHKLEDLSKTVQDLNSTIATEVEDTVSSRMSTTRLREPGQEFTNFKLANEWVGTRH
jgi:hypothetical protein